MFNYLSSPVFEPPDSVSLALWTLKTVFLVAATSVAWVSELQDLVIRPELSHICHRSVSLRPNLAFLPHV